MPSSWTSKGTALVVDVSPLWELEYTGISNVVLELGKRFLEARPDQGYDIFFSIFHRIVDPGVIEQSIAARHGASIRALFKKNRRGQCTREWSARRSSKTAGLYLHVKPEQRVFEFESQLYYDLSFLSVPECHTPETIDYHTRNLHDQVATTDRFFAISQSTARDLNFYFGVDPELVDVAYLGAHIDAAVESEARDVLSGRAVEPYFLCLGTIEPRKNVRLILAWLAQNTDVLTRYRFVFIGRNGWGKTFTELLTEYGLQSFESNGRIVHLGYVTEAQKTVLMGAAKGLLYPSLFEGFGLPVLEAMALSTPVACSCSTSLPEVLGPNGIYFDPYSVESFSAAMNQLIFEDVTGRFRERCADLRQRSEDFSYDRCFEVIRSSLETHFLLSGRKQDAKVRRPSSSNSPKMEAAVSKVAGTDGADLAPAVLASSRI